MQSLADRVEFSSEPTRDQLQAVIGGIPALWLGSGKADMVHAAGEEPVLEEGYWREGSILVPKDSVARGPHWRGFGDGCRSRQRLTRRFPGCRICDISGLPRSASP